MERTEDVFVQVRSSHFRLTLARFARSPLHAAMFGIIMDLFSLEVALVTMNALASMTRSVHVLRNIQMQEISANSCLVTMNQFKPMEVARIMESVQMLQVIVPARRTCLGMSMLAEVQCSLMNMYLWEFA